MFRFLKRSVWVLSLALLFLVFHSHSAFALQPDSIEELSIAGLESQLVSKRAEKEELAVVTFRSGVGNLGWESRFFRSSQPKNIEYAKISLAREYLIDQIVLVPVLWQDNHGKIESEGFPVEFKIIIGTANDLKGSAVATIGESDHSLPRTVPFIIPIDPILGSWVRIEVSKLTAHKNSEKFQVELSEIMVFSGEENVALGCDTEVSSTKFIRVKATGGRTLTDGFTPYQMNAAQGEGSGPYVSFFRTGPQASLTLDLKQPRNINRVHLHAANSSGRVPQLHHADYAIPDHFIIEGASESDFSDAEKIYEYRKSSIYNSGPILMAQFAPVRCQYLRLTAMKAYKAPEASNGFRCIGFEEIEVFEHGENVALEIPPTCNIREAGLEDSRDGNPSRLTDGQNTYGSILSLRQWMSQLARHHELEQELSSLQVVLKDKHLAQGRTLKWAIALIALLAGAIVTTIWITRTQRIREADRLKERFAADVHDEVGASLHAIGLLSDLAKTEINGHANEKMDSLLAEIRGVTEEASTSMRQVIDAQAKSPYSDLPVLMRQAADRILIGVDHQLAVEGKEQLVGLRPQTRAQLLLFFKECLVNASRHAEATRLATNLKVTPKTVQLAIEDNGHGIEDSVENKVPPSLLRRAKLLGAEIHTQSSPTTGTRIELNFNRLQWKHFGKR